MSCPRPNAWDWIILPGGGKGSPSLCLRTRRTDRPRWPLTHLHNCRAQRSQEVPNGNSRNGPRPLREDSEAITWLLGVTATTPWMLALLLVNLVPASFVPRPHEEGPGNLHTKQTSASIREDGPAGRTGQQGGQDTFGRSWGGTGPSREVNFYPVEAWAQSSRCPPCALSWGPSQAWGPAKAFLEIETAAYLSSAQAGSLSLFHR